MLFVHNISSHCSIIVITNAINRKMHTRAKKEAEYVFKTLLHIEFNYLDVNVFIGTVCTQSHLDVISSG